MSNFIPFKGEGQKIRGSSSTSTDTDNEDIILNDDDKTSIWKKVFSGKKKLDTNIDIDQDIERFKQHSHKLFSPNMLYKKESFLDNSAYIRRISEIPITCGDNDHTCLPIIDKKLGRELAQKRLNYLHMGLVVIGIKGMTRQQLGAHTLITLYDDRMPDKQKKIIAFTDVDMNVNCGLFYCAPTYFLKSSDIGQIKVGIMTKGYGHISHDNLVITLGFLGKAVPNTQIKYKCSIDNVIAGLASRGVRLIETPRFSGETYAGTSWDVDKLFQSKHNLVEPQKGEIFTGYNGNISVRFSQYRDRTAPPTDNSDTSSTFHVDEDGDFDDIQQMLLRDNYTKVSKHFSPECWILFVEFFLAMRDRESRIQWINKGKRNNRPKEVIDLFSEYIDEGLKRKVSSNKDSFSEAWLEHFDNQQEIIIKNQNFLKEQFETLRERVEHTLHEADKFPSKKDIQQLLELPKDTEIHTQQIIMDFQKTNKEEIDQIKVSIDKVIASLVL